MPLVEQNNALTHLILAMAKPFEQGTYARGLSEDEATEPYQPMMSVVESPDWNLPWLANFTGELIPIGIDAEKLRARLLGRFYQRRGKPATIIELVRTYLSFPQYCMVEENVGGNMFMFNVYVRSTQVLPGYDLDDLRRAIAAIRPAGYTFQLISSPSTTWQEAHATWNAANGTWNDPGTPPA